MTRSPTPGDALERLPFSTSYQVALLRLILEDPQVAKITLQYLKPTTFDGEPLAWLFTVILRFYQQYKHTPRLDTIDQFVAGLDSRVRPTYEAVLSRVRRIEIKDAAWLRDTVQEFCRRSLFAQAFIDARDAYNAGRFVAAYDRMGKALDELARVNMQAVDRSWFFEELPQRLNQRQSVDPWTEAVPTGLAWLDQLMDGGLHRGELGIWVGYPKSGKSSMLIRLGAVAARAGGHRVLHCVFEGSRAQTEARYDTAFSATPYSQVKRGELKDRDMTMTEYQALRNRLVVRAWTGENDDWRYTVGDVEREIRDLKKDSDWVPDLVLVDYGDLLAGSMGPYHSETERQTAAFRELKSLANHGYAVWTASQAQRPTETEEVKVHFLHARRIADAYAKVRVADFVGSVNQTPNERMNKILRVYAELYRDAAADRFSYQRCDFGQMCIEDEPGLSGAKDPKEAYTDSSVVPRQTSYAR